MKFPRLSSDLPSKRDGLSCQQCGSEMSLERWEECDDNDIPEGIFVTLCTTCAESLIEAHARAYRRAPRLELPGEWFEDEGVQLKDAPHAIFLHDDQPFLGLFVRTSKTSIAPMAVSRLGNITLVVACDVSGILNKSVHLTLQDKEGARQSLKIPLSSLAKGFEDTASSFLKWAHRTSPAYQVMHVPRYMFARNIKLVL